MGARELLIIAEIRLPTSPRPIPVLLSSSEREHIYRRHPEIRHYEHVIVQAFRHPRIVIKDIVHDSTLNFFADCDSQHHVMVSLELGVHPDVGRVKSARIQRTSRTLKMKSKALAHYGVNAVVFENEGK